MTLKACNRILSDTDQQSAANTFLSSQIKRGGWFLRQFMMLRIFFSSSRCPQNTFYNFKAVDFPTPALGIIVKLPLNFWNDKIVKLWRNTARLSNCKNKSQQSRGFANGGCRSSKSLHTKEKSPRGQLKADLRAHFFSDSQLNLHSQPEVTIFARKNGNRCQAFFNLQKRILLEKFHSW